MKFDFEKESKKPIIKNILIEIFIWVAEIAAVIFLAYFIVHYTLERTEMVGDDMQTVIEDGDSIILNKFTYLFSNPKRFDLIVYKQYGNENNYYEISRVVGLPGETIQIMDGDIYINDEKIFDPVIAEKMENAGLASEKIQLADNEYFILADNRNNGIDSRFASVGNILEDEIIGKAWLRLSPFNFVGKLNLKKETAVKQDTEENETIES